MKALNLEYTRLSHCMVKEILKALVHNESLLEINCRANGFGSVTTTGPSAIASSTSSATASPIQELISILRQIKRPIKLDFKGNQFSTEMKNELAKFAQDSSLLIIEGLQINAAATQLPQIGSSILPDPPPSPFNFLGEVFTENLIVQSSPQPISNCADPNSAELFSPPVTSFALELDEQTNSPKKSLHNIQVCVANAVSIYLPTNPASNESKDPANTNASYGENLSFYHRPHGDYGVRRATKLSMDIHKSTSPRMALNYIQAFFKEYRGGWDEGRSLKPILLNEICTAFGAILTMPNGEPIPSTIL